MKPLKTLRFRFAFWVAGLLLTALVVFSVYVYFSLMRGLDDLLDDSLRLNASQAISAVDVDAGKIVWTGIFADDPDTADLLDSGVTIRLLTPTGQVLQAFGLYRDLPITAENLAAAQQRQTAFVTLNDPAGHGAVRFYTAPFVDDGQLVGIIQVAETLAGNRATLDRLLTALLVSVPLLVIFAAGGGYFLAARGLAPIDQITRTARRISVEDLYARLNLPPTDDEVGRLAATFDDMLARLDESFRRERQFVTDASHELRTPLTAIQAILTTTRAKRRTLEEHEQALADLADEADRLRSLIEGLLLLARGDERQLPPREVVDLSTLLRDVTDSMRPLADAKGLTLTCAVPDGLVLSGDSDGLIRLFANLLDNAVKYTERGGITVTADDSPNNHTLRVEVADTGIGIPAEHRPHIFDRFYRMDQSRSTRGAGLGLAIALNVARTHGGTIEVSSSLGAGTTFIVILPALG